MKQEPVSQSWLFPLDRLSAPQGAPLRITVESGDAIESKKQSVKEKIHGCSNVNEVLVAVRDESIHLTQNPEVTCYVLPHAIAAQWHAKDLAELLTEPLLNPPSLPSNHAQLFCQMRRIACRVADPSNEALSREKSFLQRLLRTTYWQTLTGALFRAARLGLISPAAFQETIDSIYAFAERLRDRRRIDHVVCELLNNFELSKVFCMADLEKTWVDTLVNRFSPATITIPATKIMLLLDDRQHVVALYQDLITQVTNVEAVTTLMECLPHDVLEDLLATFHRHVLSPSAIQLLSQFMEEEKVTELVCSSMLRALEDDDAQSWTAVVQALPPASQAAVFASVTGQCMRRIHSLQMDPKVFPRWTQQLTALKTELGDLAFLLEPRIFTILRDRLEADVTPQEQLLVAVWIVTKMTRVEENDPALPVRAICDRLGIRKDFDSLLSIDAEQLKRQGLRLLGPGLICLHDDALFLKQLLETFPPRLMDQSTALEAHVVLENNTPELNFSDLMVDQLYHDLRLQLNDSLVQLCEGVNADLDAFNHLARGIIHGDKLAIRVIKRVMSNNMALKMSLSQSFAARIEFRKRTGAAKELESDKQETFRNTCTDVGRGRRGDSAAKSTMDMTTLQKGAIEDYSDSFGLSHQEDDAAVSPNKALQIIESLALAFASSPTLKPRSALIQVYWCYLFLYRYGAPITSPIARALFHAGVTRYKGKGPAVTQLRWILGVVKKAEGEHVARMLLHNSHFRQHRADLLNSLFEDGDEAQLKAKQLAKAEGERLAAKAADATRRSELRAWLQERKEQKQKQASHMKIRRVPSVKITKQKWEGTIVT